MKIPARYYGKKLLHLCSSSFQSSRVVIIFCYRNLLLRSNPFMIHLFYFTFLSFTGYEILKSLKPRTEFKPRDIDLFFTSVSAATVSSMSTVEMEVFSNSQLVVMTVLMFLGGEVFISMMGLHLKKSKVKYDIDELELGKNTVPVIESGVTRFASDQNNALSLYNNNNNTFIRCDSIKFLGFVVLGYLLVIQILGISSVLAYLALISSAEDILKKKGLKTFTFAVFTVVSTFSSCGFIPTNENMSVFRENSGLSVILIPQVLLGNTLFPCALRLSIWVLGKRYRKGESEYLLRRTSHEAVGYAHLLPSVHSKLLIVTVLGFVFVGFVLFCAMDWDLEGLNGLNVYQKAVGVMFQCVNARHAGETILDLSTIAPAILVFFAVMMYLPPYTSFLPINYDAERDHEFDRSEGCKKRRKRVAETLIFSQLSYIVIFIMLVCITERNSLKRDPINFSVFNIVFEVISAYGNVGFSTGYSCERQINKEANCVDRWYGFSGKWSDEGKIILIVVMFFGRLRKFNMNGGQAWKLL